ncbi:MAG: ferritin [Saprospiraceae bacterium]|nr:ferritin [Saprospiraceae bacterium]
MLSSKMEAALNKQLELEGYASFLYLSMASWCEREGLEGCAKFMYRQSMEENEHMMRIFNYINETDGHALAPAINQPPHTFESVKVLFDQVYAHEQKVTASINNLVALSYEEKDHATLNFLQWYVEEQREEEALMRTILDRIKLIGDGPQSLYYIDLELEKINEIEEKAEAESEA